MIDLHSHYLPEVDDGSESLRESIALLRLAEADGAERVVLTPHLYSGRWDNTLSFLRSRFDSFREVVRSKGLQVELYLGAEVRLQPELVQLLEAGEVPFLGGWEDFRVILLELEDGRVPPGTLNAVRYLKQRGVLPMIAHPERNKAVMADVSVLEPLLGEGCLLQLTAASVTGDFGRRAEAAAHALIERGWATVVATDAHNQLHRPPMMRPARDVLVRRYGADLAEELTYGAPARVLDARAQLGIN